MTIALTSPVTGGAQTGLTSPTYTHVVDKAPTNNAVQYAVTALGGTQTGVVATSASSPFLVTFVKPVNAKAPRSPNPVTGVIPGNDSNTYWVILTKGVQIGANQPTRLMKLKLSIDVPVGADSYDPNSVRAALSAFVGTLNQQSSGLGDTLVSFVF